MKLSCSVRDYFLQTRFAGNLLDKIGTYHTWVNRTNITGDVANIMYLSSLVMVGTYGNTLTFGPTILKSYDDVGRKAGTTVWRCVWLYVTVCDCVCSPQHPCEHPNQGRLTS